MHTAYTTVFTPWLAPLHTLVTTQNEEVENMVLPLSYIKPGEQAHVVWLASEAHMKQRLLDLGFAPDESLSCVLKSPRGGMGAYLVRGAVIALRQENANEIFVEI